MIEKVSKKLTQFYQISLVLIMVATLSIILYFWKLGFIDGSKTKDLHQASYILETYETKDLFNEVKGLIHSESPKFAIEKTKQIEKDLNRVNSIVSVNGHEELVENIQRMKTSAANLISFSKVSKVIIVFNKKLDKFFSHVRTQKWRTLTRMTDRIYAQTRGYVDTKKISILVSNVRREFKTMVKITENSVLSRKEKGDLVSRIENLKTEMNMLQKYSDERKFYDQIFNESKISLNKWLEAVTPEVIRQKLQMDNIGKYYVLGLLGILSLVALVFFASFIANKMFFTSARNKMEENFEDFINETLLEGKPFDKNLYSENFQNYSLRMASYFNKRMSYGSIFQEALPFSSILLDHNLKVLWANKQFCSDIEISEQEMKKEYMSWDFISKLMNIGDNDPVVEALKNEVAGIYQVKIKSNNELTASPFEMFVSPVKFKGQTRIMLFFYNLTNLEDTITDQARCLLSPIHKSLELISTNNFSPGSELEQEFAISDNTNLYEQFVKINEQHLNSEEALLDRVELLFSEIEAFEKQNTSFSKVINESLKNSKQNIKALRIFKENVIALSSLSNNLEKSNRKSFQVIFEQRIGLESSIRKINDVKEIAADVFSGMPKLQAFKEQIRNSKASVYESKSRLSYELAQLTLLMKRSNDPGGMEKLGRSLNKFNLTFSSFSDLSDELDKKISNIELLLSKTQILVNTGEQKLGEFSTHAEKSQVDSSAEFIKTFKHIYDNSEQKLNESEASIVESLYEIFKGTKSNIQLNAQLRDSFYSSSQLITSVSSDSSVCSTVDQQQPHS